MDYVTRLDLFALGRDYIREKATKIDPVQVDIAGSDINLIVGSQSMMGDALIRQMSYRFAAMLLDGAEFEDLDRLVYDRYNLVRKGASPSVTIVELSRPTNAAGAGTLPIGTKVETPTGVEFITTTTATFGAGDFVTTAKVRSTQSGILNKVAAGSITRISKVADLFDKTIRVTNRNPSSGGEDPESDEDLRNRARKFFESAQRGTLTAIETGALTVPGVVSATAVENTQSGGESARLVTLYIADSSGVSDQALADEVRIALKSYRAAGIQVYISTSVPQSVQVQITGLKYAASSDTVTIRDKIQASIVEFINSLPVNGSLLLSDLYSVIRRYAEDGVSIPQGAIALPAGDLIPEPGRTLRVVPSDVVVSSV